MAMAASLLSNCSSPRLHASPGAFGMLARGSCWHFATGRSPSVDRGRRKTHRQLTRHPYWPPPAAHNELGAGSSASLPGRTAWALPSGTPGGTTGSPFSCLCCLVAAPRVSPGAGLVAGKSLVIIAISALRASALAIIPVKWFKLGVVRDAKLDSEPQ